MKLLFVLLSSVIAFVSSIGMSVSTQSTSSGFPSQKKAPVASASISRNWSGYVAQNGVYTGVQGTWVVPQVSTTEPFAADATWIGIGGVDTHDLIQAGVETLIRNNGHVVYQAFYETLPDASSPLDMQVNAGDSITTVIAQNNKGLWSIAVKNNTNGQKTAVTVSYDSSLSSAEWIEEAPSTIRRIMPLDNFGSVQFTQAKAFQNGKSVTLADAHAEPTSMGSPVEGMLATASVIGDDASSFSIQRVNQNPQDKRQQKSQQLFYRHNIQNFWKMLQH